AQQEIRRRLSARARAGILRDHSFGMMEAVINPRKRDALFCQLRAHLRVDGEMVREARFSLRVIGLVGHYKQRKARLVQLPQATQGAGSQREIRGGQRRFVLAACRIEDVAIDYAIAVEKDRSAPSWATCSHFISFRLSPGC